MFVLQPVKKKTTFGIKGWNKRMSGGGVRCSQSPNFSNNDLSLTFQPVLQRLDTTFYAQKHVKIMLVFIF